MKTLKKILIALLVFMFIPVFASAATVAKIGDNEYETVEAAVEAATAGQTIDLVADGGLPVIDPQNNTHTPYEISKEITIKLNGHTLVGDIINNGNLTIKGTGILDATFTNNANHTLTIDSVQMSAGLDFTPLTGVNNNNVGGVFKNYGNLTFKTSTITSAQYSILANYEGGIVTFTDGTYNSRTILNRGTITINSGEFGSGETLFKNYGNIIINDGTFSATTIGENYNEDIDNGSQKITINKGTFNTTSTALSNMGGNSTIEINGGTFNSDTTAAIISNNMSATYAAPLSGKLDVAIVIKGGTINALKSAGIYTATSENSAYTYRSNNITIGSDDGTVNRTPVIHIPRGRIGSEYNNANEKFSFFDGRITLAKEISNFTEPLTNLLLPSGFVIVYDDTTIDGVSAKVAYLATIGSAPLPSTPADDVSSEETSSTDGEEEIKNPKTGAFIASTIALMGVIIFSAIIVNKKRSKLHKI